MATIHNIVNLPTADEAVKVFDSEGAGRDVTIQNISSHPIFIGGEGVTTEDFGFKLVANAAISFELDGQDDIFAVSGNDNVNIAILSINLERTR